MAVGGNNNATGGAKNISRAQGERTVKVKAHTRTIRPRTPQPTVKEQHQAVALERAQAPANPAKQKRLTQLKGAAPSPGRSVALRENHATIGQTRPDRVAARHADRAAALVAMRDAAQTAAERLPPLAPHAKHSNIFDKIGHLVTGALHDVYGGNGKKGGSSREAAAGGLGTASIAGIGSSIPARAARDTGLTIASDPLHQGPKALKDTAESLVSIPAGLVRGVSDPTGTAKQMFADYKRRYGSLAQPGGDAKFIARQKKEGVAPELFDLAAIGGGAGAAAGRGLGALARAGKIGRLAEDIATTRPALRVAGDVAKTQEVHPNLFRAAVHRAADAGRAKVLEHRVDHGTANAVEQEARQAGQVTHVLRAAQKHAQRRDVAEHAGRALLGLKATNRRIEREVHRLVKPLTHDQHDALKYAVDFGITDARSARSLLARHAEQIAAARREAAAAGKRLNLKTDELPTVEHLIQHADEVFTPELRQVADRLREIARGTGHTDAALTGEVMKAREHKPLAQLLDIKRRKGETADQFAARVRTAAAEHGATEPGYFKSEKRPAGVFSSFAIGGSKAVRGPKRYTGELQRTGTQLTDTATYLRGVHANVKRYFNWNHVADTIDRHALPWSRGNGKGMTVAQILDEIDQRHIDPNSVVLWDPRKFRQAADAAAHNTDEGAHAAETEAAVAGSGGAENKALHEAVTHASYEDWTNNPDQFKNGRYVLVPKATHDEIASSTKPSGFGGRAYDVTKGKVSRVLLANPAWLQFQIAANGLQSAMHGTGFTSIAKAQLWWRKLSDAERNAIEPYLGIHPWVDEQTRLGAATNSRVVNAYRAWKTTPLYHALHKANPFDAIFRVDNAQNNLFRRAVAYNSVKREAYRRMGHDAGLAMRLQQRMAHVLTLGPEQQMREIIRDPKLFEKHAEAVRDFLGDYTTYTKAERRFLGRAVMFYGFLRFSLRFTLHTMPIKHPIMSAIGLQLGRLERDELNQIFGGATPPWEIGNYYTKNGGRVQTKRLVPFFNALDFQGPQAVATMISPVAQIALNQIAGKNVAFDQLYNVDGKTTQAQRGSDLGTANRVQIALKEFLEINPYYRAAEKVFMHGKQGSDSLLLHQEPIQFKRPDKVAENRSNIVDQKRHAANTVLSQFFAPFVPDPEGRQRIKNAKNYAQQQANLKGKGKANVKVVRGGSAGAPQLPQLPPLPPLPTVR